MMSNTIDKVIKRLAPAGIDPEDFATRAWSAFPELEAEFGTRDRFLSYVEGVSSNRISRIAGRTTNFQ